MPGFLPPTVAVLLGEIGDFKVKMDEAMAKSAETDAKIAESGKLGKLAFMAVGAAVAGVAVESVKLATEFDAAMTRINTQDNAQLTTKQMKDLKNSVLDLAGPTAQAPEQLADAMIHVYGSGLQGAQALDLLRVAAEGATIGHANLTDVTNALDAAVAVGIKGTGDYNAAMGELNATVGAGDMTMQQLAEALGGPMLATVKGYGLSITDVGAALAVFGDRNIRGADAATQLRMATQALAVPAAAPAAARALEGIGLATTSLRDDLQKGGLKLALNDLNNHLLAAGYNSTTAGALITTAFGKKAGGGLNVLMDSLASSTSNFNDKFKMVAESGKTFAADWAQTQDTLAYKIKSLGSELEALAIKFGNVLIPYVTAAIGWIGKFGTEIHNALDSPAGRQAGDVLAAVFRDLAAFMKDAATAAIELGRAIEPAAAMVATVFLGGLRAVGAILADVVGPALKAFGGFLQDNAGIIKVLAEVALAGLIARLLYLKTLAAIDMFSSFVNGVSAAATAIAGFVKQVASGQIFDTLRLKAMVAGDAVSGLAGKFKATAVEAEGASAASGGWASKLGMALPIVGGVVLGVQLLSQGLDAVTHSSEKSARAVNDMVNNILDIAGNASQAAPEIKKLAATAMDLGSPTGPSQAAKDLDAAFASMVQHGNIAQAQAAMALLQKQILATTNGSQQMVDTVMKVNFSSFTKAVADASTAQRLNATATDGTTAALGKNAGAANGAAGAVAGLPGPLDAATAAALAASDALTAVADAFTTLTNNLKASKDLDTFKKDLLEVKGELDKNGSSMKDNTLAGLANRDAFRNAADAILTYRDANIKNGAIVADANKTAADQAAQLLKVWEQAGANKTQVEAYAKSLGLIPKDLQTDLTVKQVGLDEAIRKLDILNAKRLALGDPILLGGTRIQANAAGGLISGPGTGTSDSIASWLSNGEYVVNAAAVSKLGVPFMNALNGGDLNHASAVLGGGGIPAGGPSFTSSGVSGGGDTVVTVYVQDPGTPGWRTAANTRTEIVRYQQRNSRNNLSLSGYGT